MSTAVNAAYVGNKVQLFDKSHIGTIVESDYPYRWKIEWDDGDVSHVHPSDVTYLGTIDHSQAPAIEKIG